MENLPEIRLSHVLGAMVLCSMMWIFLVVCLTLGAA